MFNELQALIDAGWPVILHRLGDDHYKAAICSHLVMSDKRPPDASVISEIHHESKSGTSHAAVVAKTAEDAVKQLALMLRRDVR